MKVSGVVFVSADILALSCVLGALHCTNWYCTWPQGVQIQKQETPLFCGLFAWSVEVSGTECSLCSWFLLQFFFPFNLLCTLQLKAEVSSLSFYLCAHHRLSFFSSLFHLHQWALSEPPVFMFILYVTRGRVPATMAWANCNQSVKYKLCAISASSGHNSFRFRHKKATSKWPLVCLHLLCTLA